MITNKIRNIALILFFVLFANSVNAKPGCPDAKVLSSKLMTDICWDCLFPIKIAGTSLGGGNVPDGASDKILCSCKDNNGVPFPGLMVGMWEPARLIELVRQPGCMASLNGASIPVDKRSQGVGVDRDSDTSGKTYYHYHYYAFPLTLILDLFTQKMCFSDGFTDFDLMFMSELDPTWNNSELAFFTHPEAAAVANPMAITACSADAIAATAGKPIDNMWWCAGSWGNLYPFSGFSSAAGMPQATSLLATRSLATLHRRGMARRTMGSDASCKAPIDPMLPKSQYKMGMFFPRPETSKAHVIGESTMKWGLGRTIPQVGEDAVYVLYRWKDCCATNF